MTGKPHERELQRRFFVFDRTVCAGQQRQAGFLHRAAGTSLVAHQPDDFGSGPMNLMWQASQTSAKYADSDRNP